MTSVSHVGLLGTVQCDLTSNKRDTTFLIMEAGESRCGEAG